MSSSSNGKRHTWNGGNSRGSRAKDEEENEKKMLERERAFDAGLIGPGGVIAPGAGMIELASHPEEFEDNGGNIEVVQQGRNIDLNMPILEVGEDESARICGGSAIGEGVEQGYLRRIRIRSIFFLLLKLFRRKG